MDKMDNEGLSDSKIEQMAESRIKKLEEAGVNEGDVLGSAQDNIANWVNYFQDNIVRGRDDMNFLLRDQWTDQERAEFQRLLKPALTFNKLYDSVKKIVGEQRNNKPDLIVRSLNGMASQEEITLRQDLVRTISYKSQNDLVYQAAFMSAMARGFGAFQICVDYETPTSFNQVINYDIIPDPTQCMWDPTALKPHKGDGNFCARNYVMTLKQFAATYPYITNPQSYSDPRILLDYQWQVKDSIVLCDYFVKEWFPVIIYKLSNGMSVTKEEWDGMQKMLKFQEALAEGSPVVGDIIRKEIPRIVAERQGEDYKVMHYRLLKDQIIDFALWPSRHLPIIYVDGDSHFVDGRQYTRSFIQSAKDSQRFLNYLGSEIAAEVKNRRREQWLGTPDNVNTYEQMWRNPELQIGILLAKPDSKTGMMPVKQPASEIPQGLLLNFQRATQDIREILGFSEAEQQSRDISGSAKRERRIEGSMSAMIQFSNLNQSLEQGGRVVLDLLPAIYGHDERTVVINKPDGNTQSLVLNKQVGDDTQNALEKGDFDIEIDAGPSFAVQKSAALELMMQLVQTNPQVFPLVADLIAKNLDVQFMPQIVERLQTLVPPQILAEERGEEPPPQQPSPEEEIAHMQQEIEIEGLKARKSEIEMSERKLKLDEAKLMMEMQKIQAELQMKAQESQENMQMKREDMASSKEKNELDYTAKIAKIIADLQKDGDKSAKRSKND